jgi:hypothetical protein
VTLILETILSATKLWLPGPRSLPGPQDRNEKSSSAAKFIMFRNAGADKR